MVAGGWAGEGASGWSRAMFIIGESKPVCCSAAGTTLGECSWLLAAPLGLEGVFDMLVLLEDMVIELKKCVGTSWWEGMLSMGEVAERKGCLRDAVAISSVVEDGSLWKFWRERMVWRKDGEKT